jgi:hypothetical protein
MLASLSTVSYNVKKAQYDKEVYYAKEEARFAQRRITVAGGILDTYPESKTYDFARGRGSNDA